MEPPVTNHSGPRRSSHPVLLRLAVLALGIVLGGLAAFAAWFFLGGGIWRSEIGIANAELRPPDTLTLIVNSCQGDPEVTLLQETDVDVQVEVVASSTPLRGGEDCQDVVEAQLEEPLGDRVVVDKHTGESVSVSR